MRIWKKGTWKWPLRTGWRERCPHGTIGGVGCSERKPVGWRVNWSHSFQCLIYRERKQKSYVFTFSMINTGKGPASFCLITHEGIWARQYFIVWEYNKPPCHFPALKRVKKGSLLGEVAFQEHTFANKSQNVTEHDVALLNKWWHRQTAREPEGDHALGCFPWFSTHTHMLVPTHVCAHCSPVCHVMLPDQGCAAVWSRDVRPLPCCSPLRRPAGALPQCWSSGDICIRILHPWKRVGCDEMDTAMKWRSKAPPPFYPPNTITSPSAIRTSRLECSVRISPLDGFVPFTSYLGDGKPQGSCFHTGHMPQVHIR